MEKELAERVLALLGEEQSRKLLEILNEAPENDVFVVGVLNELSGLLGGEVLFF